LLSVIGITAFSILTIDSSSWRGWCAPVHIRQLFAIFSPQLVPDLPTKHGAVPRIRYPSEILLRVPIDNWRAYESAVSSDPVPIKAAITGATYFIGDWLAQAIELKQQSRSWRDANRLRIVKNALVGLLLLGPLAHFYYEFVTDQLDSWPIPAKIVIDQTIYLGVYNTLYCVALGILGGRAAKDVVEEVRTTFIPLIVAGWKLWPLVGIVTYTLIPSEHRVLWIDAIEVFYSVILSTIANQQKA